MGIPVFEQHVDEYGNVYVRVSQDVVVLTRDDADRVKARLDQLKVENARLRELLRAAYNCTNAGPSCLECRVVAGGCTLLTAMRELGVEVDG